VKEVELLRKENLKFAQAIAPRVFRDADRAITNLARFKGMKAILSRDDQAEPTNTSAQIKWVLEQAGWQVTDGKGPVPVNGPRGEYPWFDTAFIPLREGVIVETAMEMHSVPD